VKDRQDRIDTAPGAAGGRPEPDVMTPEVAAERLTDWGFLARADFPDAPGEAHLIVGLRDAPTEVHFDPEVVDCWVTSGEPGHERGTRLSIRRSTRLPIDRDFSWGLIRIVDRFGISNEYVAFGGRLVAAEVRGMTVCVFTSPAPILRRGGHSQLADWGSFDLAAWFARVLLAVDYVPGFESRVAEATPLGRYAAFVGDFIERRRASPALRAADAELWAEGEELRVAAGLIATGGGATGGGATGGGATGGGATG
jgi:hypothetical protein